MRHASVKGMQIAMHIRKQGKSHVVDAMEKA